MTVRIREMVMEDLPGALEVEKRCFGKEAWSEASYHATLLLPYAHYFVAEEVLPPIHRIVGTLGLRLIAGEGEITNVAVLPDCRGRSISSLLMQEAIDRSAGSDVRDLTLEVRAGNIPAISLYEKFGFAVEGRRPGFYRNPTEDALIMWRRGPHGKE